MSAGQLDSPADHSPFGLFLLLVAVLLLLVALRQLRRALMPIAELVRMALSAGVVVVLILAAVALVVASVVIHP